MGRQTILNKIAQFILTGGRRTTAAGTRDVLNEMANTYVSCIYDTAANFTANNPILETKQIGVETDDLTTVPKFKIGNGVNDWNTLPYFAEQTGGTWGSITGTLSNQTDLQTALNAKEDTLNKTSTVTGNESSTSKYLTVKGVYDWVTGLFVKKGTLTTNTIPKATASDTIGNSQITDDGTNVGIVGNIQIGGVGDARLYIKNANGNYYFAVENGGGLSIFYINPNGRVSIGTLQDLYKLKVDGSFASATIVDDGANVGINTLPSEKLHVNGNIRCDNLTASQIVETDASKNLVSAAKGTAYNKDFGTGTTNIPEIGSTLVASEITATDSNGKLQSLNASTYPSLTELSYVKGLTSPVQSQINLKEPSISGSGNTTDFWSGAKTFRNLSTDIRATVLTGLSLVTSQTIAATDTVLQAFGYLQAQITANKNSIDSKTLFKTTTDTSTHTGTLTNTIVFSEDISNKLSSGDIAEIVSDVVRVSGSTSTTIRYYLNSSNSLTGATAIGVYTYGFSGLNIADFRRQLIVKSSTSIRIKGASSSLLNDYGVFSNYTDVSVNLGSLWIIFAITLGNTGDQFLVSSRKMVK